MKLLSLKPEVYKFDECEEFSKKFNIGENDLIITNEYIYKPFFGDLNLKSKVLFQENYGKGEPSDEMVDQMFKDLEETDYKRVIAIGGGSVLDVAKLFALENVTSALDLFEKRILPNKIEELVLVPTTCGTGSEVTGVSILELKSRNTKLGLAAPELFADQAVLIPKLLVNLPYKFFVYSSIDALIHACESSLSPNATSHSKLFAYDAIRLILNGFKEITIKKKDYRDINLLENFLVASNYAGISFGNVGTGAVHAMSYPLGGKYHVPHGEANYCFFIEIFRTYTQLNPNGEIGRLNKFISEILSCEVEDVYDELEKLLNKLKNRKKLKEYGVTKEDLTDFTNNVINKQQRLTKTNYVSLDEDQIYKIYLDLYK